MEIGLRSMCELDMGWENRIGQERDTDTDVGHFLEVST
jgi:hypothetical protein